MYIYILCQHGKFSATLLLKFFVLYYKRNMKHFSVLIYSYINTRENWKNSKLCENTPPCGRRGVQLYQHEWKLEKREIVWKYDARRAIRRAIYAQGGAFSQFRVFPIFTSVDITVYQYGKNVLYFFYNIAHRTLTEEWREIFRVDRVMSTRLLANQRSDFTYAVH